MTRRRHLIATALAVPLLGALGRALAADPAPKETAWEELMPKDWDPMKEFRAGDVGLVQEGSVKERNMMRQMRELWDNAPTNPKMDGARVRLPGYVVPLEEVKGELKEFLLVPYFGACIHSPPPPANQIVHVTLGHAAEGLAHDGRGVGQRHAQGGTRRHRHGRQRLPDHRPGGRALRDQATPLNLLASSARLR